MLTRSQAQAEAERAFSQRQSSETLECYFRWSRETRFEQTQGQLETVEHKQTYGVAVRCFQDGRVGFAYRRDTRATAVQDCVAEARALAAHVPSDAARTGAVEPLRAWGPEAAPEPPFSAERISASLRAMEQSARKVDPRVVRTHQAGFAHTSVQHALFHSGGVQGAWTQSETSMGLAALAEDRGDSQMGEAYRMARTPDDLEPERIGMEAGQKAVKLLGARPLPTQERVVIFPPMVVAGLLEAMFPAFSGEAWQRGRSFLTRHAGQPIAPGWLQLVDDGGGAGLYSAPMDEEGSPTQRTELIRDGVLHACLHNRETALRGKARSTGNGVRASLSAAPAVGPMQVQLLPGRETPEALQNAYPGALVAADVLGLHTLDPVTGDFSLGASGWLLQAGGDTAVRGVTLSGNLLTWLKQIVAVGNDLRVLGHFAAPSVVVRDLLVAGE